MKAVVINQYGGKEHLQEVQFPDPIIKDHQVLVEMKATSINPIDWKLREGYLKEMLPFEFPIILGWDAAGIIKKVGKAVTKFKVGDAVFARPDTTRFGTYAEFVAIDEDKLALKPENISYVEAASIPLAGLTAWQGLFDVLKLKAGEKVLIHAGAGGVGSLAIQFAHHVGAYVATTASKENEDFVKSLGADEVIDYRTTAFEDVLLNYDAVYDTMGGEIQSKSYKVLKKDGRLVSIASYPSTEEAELYGVKAGFLWLEPNGKQLAEIGELLKTGDVKAIVGHVFPFSEQGIKDAHALSESHHARGKIVIKF
ncbi:NADP-dependent oxidoreductase [Heyndrickxia ginsengihumi]|uniref:NADP-dependent oxidoreductase n=1 Tax=Heyndrickxia ginsengihumi TaxID=363870 RepID=A0A6M0P9F6_9BACI|nr:NADP-dependent oxidoreductase [Heyndrickxia ginsengihumi]MBE6183332.1 NADP-dependent oxidoreductase [Bacillus sp. (in: firmicutes)]MCM3024106.1 NADP-dependent oxidoreductase [Heyndrickxia ginsengihumi]NEY21053.1 NADP-dependent oxidoreductase [Heyndrickxia ginsengihumi]